MMQLIIGNKNYSSWSFRPWIAMKAARHSRSTKIVISLGRRSAARSSRQGRAIYAGLGLLPVLVDDDVRVWETLAIMEYLADKFPDKGVWPRDIKRRAGACAREEMHVGFSALRGNAR